MMRRCATRYVKKKPGRLELARRLCSLVGVRRDRDVWYLSRAEMMETIAWIENCKATLKEAVSGGSEKDGRQ